MVKRSLHRLSIGFALLGAAFPVLAQDQVVTPLDDKIDITQKLGSKLPLDLKFKDETGSEIRLGDYFGKRPVVLVPVFYECNSACLLTRDGVIKVLSQQKREKLGKDFDVVVFSIKPGETAKMASDAKQYWMSNTRYGDVPEGWHFLNGDEAAIQSLTSAIGFRFYHDKENDLVVHPTCIVVTTEDGTISYYQEGAQYVALEFQSAIEKAKENAVGPKSPTITFPACYAYDPATGKYRVAVESILIWTGLATVVAIAGSIVHMSFKYRRTPLTIESNESKGGADAKPSDEA